jgi:P-type Ca2+ transporter type 2C
MIGGPRSADTVRGDGARPVATSIDAGLSSAEAAERLCGMGANELPRARGFALWRLVASQLSDPLIVVLLAAAVLTVATRDWTDASVIVLVIVVNTAVGVAQELKAGQAIAALSELAAPEARVLRDGEQRVIPAGGGGWGPIGAG